MRVGKQTDPDKFQCMKCNHKWEEYPKPMGNRGYVSAANPCPKCGSQYMKWLNWRAD